MGKEHTPQNSSEQPKFIIDVDELAHKFSIWLDYHFGIMLGYPSFALKEYHKQLDTLEREWHKKYADLLKQHGAAQQEYADRVDEIIKELKNSKQLAREK